MFSTRMLSILATSLTTILLSRYVSQYKDTSATPYLVNIDHPAFKLTDLSLMREYLKLVKVRKYEVQPGENVTVKRYKSKPRTIDEAKFYDANNSAIVNACLPGHYIHLWRITGTPQSGDDSKAQNYGMLF